jgi:hypothetical protein
MQWEGIYEEMLIMKIIYVGEDGGGVLSLHY